MVPLLAFTTACVPNDPPGPAQKSAEARKTPSTAASRRPPGLRTKPPSGPNTPPPTEAEEKAMPPSAAEETGELPQARGPGPAALPAAEDPLITEPFLDDFERPALGDEWLATSPVWKIEDGRLCGQRARNHPAWLKRRLPTDARVEFDAMSSSKDGDLKAEIWGDGRSFAKGTSYDHASSYLAIFGGWQNKFHVLARLDEHAK